MLFRQKEKIADIGKDTFREFYRREQNSVHDTEAQILQTKNSQTNLQISTQKTISGKEEQLKSYNQLPSAAQLISDGSAKPIGSTWDAQHLDKFISTSQFAAIGERTFKSLDKIGPLTQKAQNLKEKESFFFRNNYPRLSYENNNMTQLSSVNHLITQTVGENNLQNKKDFINKKYLQMPKKEFNLVLAQYTPNPDNIPNNDNEQLMLPSQKKQEFLEAKNNKEQYQSWKKELGDMSRAYKMAKRGYKSGIIGIDNPEFLQTMLYKDEQKEFLSTENLNKCQQNGRQKSNPQKYKIKPMQNFRMGILCLNSTTPITNIQRKKMHCSTQKENFLKQIMNLMLSGFIEKKQGVEVNICKGLLIKKRNANIRSSFRKQFQRDQSAQKQRKSSLFAFVGVKRTSIRLNFIFKQYN